MHIQEESERNRVRLVDRGLLNGNTEASLTLGVHTLSQLS